MLRNMKNVALTAPEVLGNILLLKGATQPKLGFAM
jgi:hypothetical protein